MLSRHLKAYRVEFREKNNTDSIIQTQIIYANVADSAKRKMLELHHYNIVILKIKWVRNYKLLQYNEFINALKMIYKVGEIY